MMEKARTIQIVVDGDPGAYATERGTRWQAAVRSRVEAEGLTPFPPDARLGVRIVVRQVRGRPSDEADLDNIVKHTIDALEGILGIRQQGGRPQAHDGRIDAIDARREWTTPDQIGATVTVWPLDAAADPRSVITLAGSCEIDLDAALAIIDSYPLTTLRIYDGPGASDEPCFTATDLGRLIVIEPMNQRVRVRLLEARLDWSLVAPGASLLTADPEGPLYAAAVELYDGVAGITGVGPAIASKILHLKRPHFFPLLDSVVRELYSDAGARAYAASVVWQQREPDWSRLYWAAVRVDLIDPANREALGELRARLLSPTSDERRQRAAALSDVRLLDILAWGAPKTTNVAGGGTENS